MNKLDNIASLLKGLTYDEMRQMATEIAAVAKRTVKGKYNSIEISEVVNQWAFDRTRPVAEEPAPVKVPVVPSAPLGVELPVKQLVADDPSQA